MVAALGRVPQTPEEALAVLGALLRANPAEKEEFIGEAHLAWVGGGWEIEGDTSPEARVVLMALAEATRRLAERYGWKRGGGSSKLRVTEEVARRVVVVVQAKDLPKEAVFRVGPQGLSQAALWKAAYLVAEGKVVYLVGPVAHKVKRMVLDRAARLLAKAASKVRMPWGEEVPLLKGDRWEDLEAPEPRIAAALRELRKLVEEVVEEEEENEVAGDWAHQTRVSRRALKALWVQLDPEARGVEAVYLPEEEVLGLLDGVEVDVYNPEELHRVLGLEARPFCRQPTGWRRMVEEVVRYGRFFTYREVKEVFAERKGGDWQVYRLLQAPVAWEVQVLGFKDPESAFQEGVLEGIKVARRLKGKAMKVNPMVYLVAEVRKFLLELRAREVGVFRLSWREAEAVRRYFALIKKHGLSSKEAAEKAGLSKELRGALEAGGELSVDAFLEVGVDPTAEVDLEVDYDTYLLRERVKKVREEVRVFWGPQGEEFVELLMDGVAPYAASYQLDLGVEFADEVVAYLRRELEPWVVEA